MSLLADRQDAFGGPRLARWPAYATDELPADLDAGGFRIKNIGGTGQLNVGDYASFAAALTAVGSSTMTLVIQSSQTVATNTTVPANCMLLFLGAGKLVVSSGVSLVIARRPIAGAGQHIFEAADSTATIGISQPDGPLPLRWWGLVADGDTDDAPVIQNAIDGAGTNTVFALPEGSATIIIRSSIEIYGTVKNGVSIVGRGSGGVDFQNIVKWDGASGGYMIDVINSSGNYFSGFTLLTDNGGNVAARCINIDQTTDPGYPSGSTSNVQIENMTFTNNVANPNLIAVSVAYLSASNCELMRIKRCRFYQNYLFGSSTNLTRGIAISLGNATGGGGSNNYNQLIEENQFTNFTYDINCFVTKAVIRNNEHQFCAINIVGHGDLLVEHNRPENSRQFLKCDSGQYVLRFNDLALVGTWNASYPTIEFVGNAGAVTLDHNMWNDDGTDTIIAVACTATPGASSFRLVSKGNQYPNNQHLDGARSFGTFRYWSTELDNPLPRIQTGGEATLGHAAAATVVGTTPFSELSSSIDDGATIYVTDGTPGTNPLTGSGSGCFADRVNGVWVGRAV